MNERKVPAWFKKAKEFAARVQAPAGKVIVSAKKTEAAKVYVYDAIGKDPWDGSGIDAQDVIDALGKAEGSPELEIHINSPGGQVFDGIAIFNAIRGFAGKKTCYVDGIAASIASIIAMAGDRVVMNEGSMFMVHEPSSFLISAGNADEIEEDARKMCSALRKVRENLIDIYVSSTGRSISEISAWMAAETWMTADESKERGFADEVVRQDPEDPEEPDEDDGPEARASAPALSPRASFDLSLARARALSEQFAAASRGASPGQPGSPKPKNSGNAGRK